MKRLFWLLILVSLLSGMIVQAQEVLPVSAFVGVVSVDRAMLRSGAGDEYSAAGEVLRGRRLPLTSRTGDWYEIVLRNAQTAWIAASAITVEPYIPPSILLPAETPLYFSLDTRPGLFNRMEEMLLIMGTPPETATVPGAFRDMLSYLFLHSQINLDQIRSWLGDEVAVASLDCIASGANADATSPDVSNVVILASVLDRAGAQAFLNDVFTSSDLAQAPREDLNYNGYNYILLSDQNTSNPAVAIALINDYLVLTKNTSAMEQIIDVANGTSALDANRNFNDVYGQLTRTSLVRVYGAPDLFCPLLDSALDAASESAPANLIDGVDPAQVRAAFQGYGVGFRADAGSIEVDLVSSIDAEALSAATGMSDEEAQQFIGLHQNEFFGLLSPDMLGVLTFGTIENAAEDLNVISGASPQQTFTDETGLSSSVWGELNGDILTAYIDYPVFDSPGDTPPYYLLAITTTDDEQAQNTLDDLTTAAQFQGAVQTQTEINGVSVVTLESEDRVLQLAAVGRVVVVVTGENMVDLLGRALMNGEFVPDWQRIAGVSSEDSGNPFVAALDFIGNGSAQAARLEVAAVVIPPQRPGEPTRFTVITRICREDECE